MWPKPPPTLTHGETAVVGNRFDPRPQASQTTHSTAEAHRVPIHTAIKILIVVVHKHDFPGNREDRSHEQMARVLNFKAQPFAVMR